MFANRFEFLSLQYQNMHSCDVVCGILNLRFVNIPLWSAVAVQGFAVQSSTFVNQIWKGSVANCRSPSWSEMSHKNRPSRISFAECVRKHTEYKCKSLKTKKPSISLSSLRFSDIKILVVSLMPGLGVRYLHPITYASKNSFAFSIHFLSAYWMIY